MKPNTRRILACSQGVLIVAMASLSMHANAQVPPADVEKLVKYAQCIRANGYAEFPDPSPDGRTQLRLDPKSAPQFEAAQRACKDKLPAGMAAMDQEVTPERLQAMIGFAGCVRKKGVNEFPDPNSKGVFEITSPTLDLSTPQVREAMQSCMATNPIGGLQIRRTRPQ